MPTCPFRFIGLSECPVSKKKWRVRNIFPDINDSHLSRFRRAKKDFACELLFCDDLFRSGCRYKNDFALFIRDLVRSSNLEFYATELCFGMNLMGCIQFESYK